MIAPADLLAIQRLYAHYNNAIARGDSTAWAACFVADGVFSNIFRTVRGQDALETYAASFMADRGTRYVINNLLIEEREAGVSGTCYLAILRVANDASPPVVELTGTYTDTLTRQGGEWKFVSRHIQRDTADR